MRTGDFVLGLLRDAQTPDEFAFAIGSLAHYVGDTIGHGEAVNRSVAIQFPKLEKKYGSLVDYAQNPHAHVQAEFAFDVNQLSKYRFAPTAYLELGANKIFLERIEREVRQGGRMALIADITIPDLPTGSPTVVNVHLENKCKPGCRRLP